MRKVLESSVLFRWLTAAARWIDGQWNRSVLAGVVAGEDVRGESPGGVLTRLAALLRGLWCTLLEKTGLSRALEGSIFTRMTFWCALTLAAGPLLPTMAALGLVLLTVISVLASYGRDRALRLAYSPVTKWVLLYALVYMVATLTSVRPEGSFFHGLLSCAFILFAVVLQAAVRDRRQVETLLLALVAGGLVMSLYGFFQVLTGVESDTAWVDEDSFSYVTLRVYSFMENPNVLSEYLLLVIPLAAACTLTAETLRRRLFAAASTAAMILCMVLTLSRGGWLGLIFAAAVFLVLMDRRFIVLGAVGLVALIFVLPDAILDRFSSITDLTDSSSSYRISIWLATVNLLKDYWFCGIGTGMAAFGAVYPYYSFNAASAAHSHSLYLQVLCECGIAGFVTLAGAVCSCVRAAASTIARTADRRRKTQLIGVIASFSGFLVQSATEYSFYNYRVLLTFWVVIALGAILSRPEVERHDPRA